MNNFIKTNTCTNISKLKYISDESESFESYFVPNAKGNQKETKQNKQIWIEIWNKGILQTWERLNWNKIPEKKEHSRKIPKIQPK